MTIQEAILEGLADGDELTMDDIDSYVVFSEVAPTPSKTSVRARVYELMKAGKVVRVRRGVYALPKKVRRRKTQVAA